ncbi:hypothetical protein HID58_071011 [Brassica napus]|uniref:Uncharacterized protein n=1 Tax=Brassica napus TaxID=3708 RepID=A0ABQ7Z0E8_BRANA|nr:hypothetical protein HID58_071011 [Brassica napus]
MQLRQSYRNVWQSDLMSTVTADTPCDYLIYIVASRVSGTLAVVGTCLVVVGVEKANALNFVLPLRLVLMLF